MTTLYTAKKYAVPALEAHCVEFLKKNLRADNAFMLLTQVRLPLLARIHWNSRTSFVSVILSKKAVLCRCALQPSSQQHGAEQVCVRSSRGQQVVQGRGLRVLAGVMAAKAAFPSTSQQHPCTSLAVVLVLFRFSSPESERSGAVIQKQRSSLQTPTVERRCVLSLNLWKLEMGTSGGTSPCWALVAWGVSATLAALARQHVGLW